MAALFDTQVLQADKKEGAGAALPLEPLAAAASSSRGHAKRPLGALRSSTSGSIAPSQPSASSSVTQLGGLGAFSPSTSGAALNSREAERAQADFVEGGAEGWIVVAGCATMFFVVLGLLYSFGVIAAELTKRRLASSSTLG